MPGYAENGGFCIIYPESFWGSSAGHRTSTIKSNSQFNVLISLRELVTPYFSSAGVGIFVLRSKSNDWLVQNPDIVSEWSEISTCVLLFQ
jgi:hypothetical protein